MTGPSPRFLLDSPDLVMPDAPWCSWLHNLELGILLLAQPWIAGEGLRRAELEQQLVRMGSDLPLGPVYFQKVNRSVAALEERGQLHTRGSGRSRRFITTARGFAALVLNLQELRRDPTIDGTEFELKRALVALWNLVFDRLMSVAGPQWSPPVENDLFEDLTTLEILGNRVINDQVVADAFNLLRLVEQQQAQVQELLETARRRRESALIHRHFLAGTSMPAGSPDMAAIRMVALSEAPRLAAEAAMLRYGEYLRYLDGLAALYAHELKIVDLNALRQALGSRTD